MQQMPGKITVRRIQQKSRVGTFHREDILYIGRFIDRTFHRKTFHRRTFYRRFFIEKGKYEDKKMRKKIPFVKKISSVY